MDDHHLKFVHQGAPRPFNIQKRLFPKRSIGVSKEAPLEFQLRHTLIDDAGYFYQHEQKHAAGTNQFHNLKQSKFFTIDHRHPPEATFHSEYHGHLAINQKLFNKKTGMLSEYMDKNGWMSKVHRLMGHERDQRARDTSNKIRGHKITKLSKSPNSIDFQKTPVLQKEVAQEYFEEIPILMSERMRIRSSRNKFFERESVKKEEDYKKLSLPFRNDTIQLRLQSKQINQRAQTSRSHADQPLFSMTAMTWKRMNSTRAGTTRLGSRPEPEETVEYAVGVSEESEQP